MVRTPFLQLAGCSAVANVIIHISIFIVLMRQLGLLNSSQVKANWMKKEKPLKKKGP